MVRSEVTLPNCSETQMKPQKAIMDLFPSFDPHLFLRYKTRLLQLTGPYYYLSLIAAMSMVLLIVSSSSFVSSLSILAQSAGIPKSCFSQSVKVSSIPETHLYHRKTRPLVIGHHGNPSKFQENTVDGFKSLVGLKADGM